MSCNLNATAIKMVASVSGLQAKLDRRKYHAFRKRVSNISFWTSLPYRTDPIKQISP